MLAGAGGASYLAYAGGLDMNATLIAGAVGAGLAYGLKTIIRGLILLAILICLGVQFGDFGGFTDFTG